MTFQVRKQEPTLTITVCRGGYFLNFALFGSDQPETDHLWGRNSLKV